MNRLFSGVIWLAGIAGMGFASGCCRHGQQGSFPTPIKVDPFATPFAVVGDRETCDLSDDLARNWILVRPYGGNRFSTPADVTHARFVRRPAPRSRGFCVYRWIGGGLPPRSEFTKINGVPDGPVLGATGEATKAIPTASPGIMPGPSVAPSSDVARLKNLLRGHGDPSAVPVKVAVIDASPLGIVAPDRSRHGFAVSRLIGDILCNDVNSADCEKRVRPYLALPLIGERVGDFSEDLVTGGSTGTLFQLYDAIDRALDDWNPGTQRLVINLSMGWDPTKADPDDPIVLRIRGLLERASCMGALTIAAAGNFSGSDGPIYPAAFETLPAPTGNQCAALGISAPVGRPPGGEGDRTGERYAPLVYAVGMVDRLDQRTLIDRRWAQPRIAANGVGLTVPGGPGLPVVGPVTGTSASTATVSGIAAAVWTVRPDLDAISVMEMVYNGGVPLDGGPASKRARTEFCVGQPYGPCLGQKLVVHRASLCGALQLALPDEKLQCPKETWAKKPGPPPIPGAATAAVPPPEPCRVSNCGIPFGPMPNQLAAGTVPHTGGFAGCPGCKFMLIGNQLYIGGVPTLDPSVQMRQFTSVLVTDQGQSFPIAVNFGTPLETTQALPIVVQAMSGVKIVFTMRLVSGQTGSITEEVQLDPL